MIEKGTNISEEEVGLESQSGDYLPDEEKYDRYAEMGDYYAERATKEAQSLPYDCEVNEEYLEFLTLESALNETTLNQEEYEKILEQYNAHPGSEFASYYSQLHHAPLSKILCDVVNIHFLDVMTGELEDDLYEYREDKSENIPEGEMVFYKTDKIPKKYFTVAIVHALIKTLNENGWGIGKESGDTDSTNIYIYTKKYWDRTDSETFKRFIKLAAIKMEFYYRLELHTVDFLSKLYKQAFSQIPIYKAKQDDNTVIINLQNVTFEVNKEGISVREHNKEDFIKYILPFEYDKDAQAPLFRKYLERVLPDEESQKVLQEFHGYVFTNHLKLEKALLLYGNGANGKSVQFEIITALLGKENVSTKTLGDLVDGDSGNDNRTALQGKLLNYGSEISAKKISVDVFKRLVSGEPVAARAKYKTTIDLDGRCKFMFNANKLPETKEHTDAFYRRFIIVPYLEKIPEDERDPELHKKIIATELSGIFNWILEGLERLLRQKEFTSCKASDDIIEEYKYESNPMNLFIEEHRIVADTESKMPIKVLYELYKLWAKANGFQSLNINQFSSELSILGFTRDRGSKGMRCYQIKQLRPE
jgi:putative DNA primase/helicase